MPAATIYWNISKAKSLKHQKHAHLVKILLFFMVLALHIGLALMLLRSANIEPIKQPVFMEVLMLSVPATATQSMIKSTSLIKKEPVIAPSIIKKPPSALIKKPTMIVPAETMPSTQVVAESVPKEKAAPPSVSDSQEATAEISNVESIVKNTALNSHEQDADKNVAISGIMPLVKVNPIYPNRAVSHGIEGWVRIEFTIQADGSVANAVIVQSMPEAVFDDAALAAINQWQFKPKVVNGVAVQQRAGQQLQFKLDR